jgi:ATP-binding cassette subfamily B (MDR/TAP) protein 1
MRFIVVAIAGSLLRSLNEDTAAYQQAVSEKLGIFIQHSTTFVVGFAVAFWRGWDMTLVLLACLPLLGAVGVALSKLSARIESSSAEAYAQAEDIALQAMTQVRALGAKQSRVIFSQPVWSFACHYNPGCCRECASPEPWGGPKQCA